jgi:hypothetical protein
MGLVGGTGTFLTFKLHFFMIEKCLKGENVQRSVHLKL